MPFRPESIPATQVTTTPAGGLAGTTAAAELAELDARRPLGLGWSGLELESGADPTPVAALELVAGRYEVRWATSFVATDPDELTATTTEVDGLTTDTGAGIIQQLSASITEHLATAVVDIADGDEGTYTVQVAATSDGGDVITSAGAVTLTPLGALEVPEP